MAREFRYDLQQHFDDLSSATSSTGNVYTKEVNLISYNDADPVYDIRTWTTMASGERRMGKGITLNIDELKALKALLNEMEDLQDEQS
ncbi:MAG: hypothetical protein IKD69_08110 [Solobacterium sp.]|nr:hypothetical protein [Solobacterium sp.]